MARILVAEDSPTQAVRLVHALEEQGFEVCSAPDAERALELLAGADFDVVISDVMMPGMSGYELCRAIKSNRARAAVPVVLLTSLSEPMDVINGLACGANHFIRKPYETEDLVGRINEILANAEKRQSEDLSLGVDIVFMGNNYTITSDRAQILDLLISTFETTVRANRELRADRLGTHRCQCENQELRRRARKPCAQTDQRTRDRQRGLAHRKRGTPKSGKPTRAGAKNGGDWHSDGRYRP